MVFMANSIVFVTNTIVFVANTIMFVANTIISTTMAHFYETESIVSVLDTPFSIREKTVCEVPAAVFSHSINKTKGAEIL